MIEGTLGKVCYSYATVVQMNEEILVTDIVLCDERGQGKVSLTRIHLQEGTF